MQIEFAEMYSSKKNGQTSWSNTHQWTFSWNCKPAISVERYCMINFLPIGCVFRSSSRYRRGISEDMQTLDCWVGTEFKRIVWYFLFILRPPRRSVSILTRVHAHAHARTDSGSGANLLLRTCVTSRSSLPNKRYTVRTERTGNTWPGPLYRFYCSYTDI